MALLSLVVKVIQWFKSLISAQISSKMYLYTNVQLAGLNFRYGSGAGTQRMHVERFPGNSLLDCRSFMCIHQDMYVRGSFPAPKQDMGAGAEFLR